jgi:hypothetical protein
VYVPLVKYATCQICQITKKERSLKKYRLFPPKIAESEIIFLGHDLYGSGGFIYNKHTSQNTLYASLLALTMIDPATGWFEVVKATNNSATSIQDCFITPGWHVTRNLNLLSLTMGANSNVSS